MQCLYEDAILTVIVGVYLFLIKHTQNANGDEETFIIISLMSNCYYSYTLQVVDGNNILEMSDSGFFKTIAEDTTLSKFGTF